MSQGILVDLFAMAVPQVLMYVKTRLPDYVAQREDITGVRIGIHSSFLSFVLYVPFCGYSFLKIRPRGTPS